MGLVLGNLVDIALGRLVWQTLVTAKIHQDPRWLGPVGHGGETARTL